MSAGDFRVGESVQSPIGMLGRMVRIERGTLTAEYPGKGGTAVSTYAPEWFEKYPGMLRPAPWAEGQKR